MKTTKDIEAAARRSNRLGQDQADWDYEEGMSRINMEKRVAATRKSHGENFASGYCDAMVRNFDNNN